MIQNGAGLFEVHLHEDRMCKHMVDIIRLMFLIFRKNVLLQLNPQVFSSPYHLFPTYTFTIYMFPLREAVKRGEMSVVGQTQEKADGTVG